MRHRILYLIISLTFSQLNAQTPTADDILKQTSVQPIEPTTASLGRYGEYQMDYSNGLPDISIPLYEIKSGDLTVPIILRYQGGGIKVQQEATWVGLGWDLFYGGQVTRVVHGFPDEDEPDVSQRPTANEIRDYIALHNSDIYNSYLKTLAESNPYMPDEYYYNIGIDNGKFIGIKDKVLVPYKAVRIQGGATSWTISNPENITYSFKQNEISTTTAEHMTPRYTSAWGVEKITSPHNHTITYEYQTDGYYIPNSTSSYEGYYHSYIDISAPWYEGFELNKNYTIPLKKIFLKLKIESKKPQYIYFEGGRVTFILSSRTDITNNDGSTPIRKLDKILIERIQANGSYELIKYFQFNYFYRENRLFLSGIDEFSNSESKQVAKFEYNTTPLPAKDSYSYDYCGYYNGSSNITPVPRYNFTTNNGLVSLGGANKNVVESFTKAGSLIAIEYPTKGKTVFTWENHRYGAEQPMYDRQYITPVSASLAGRNDIQCTDPPIFDIDGDDEEGHTLVFTNYIDQTIHLSGVIERINTVSFQHEKYDKGTIICEDLTTGSILLDKHLVKSSTPIDAVLQLHVNHRYRIAVSTNCSNVRAQVGFVYNKYDPDSDKYNYPYGGLRIKEIANFDADGKLLDKNKFTYTIPDNASKSSGYITNTADILLSKHSISVGCFYEDLGAVITKYTNKYTETHLYYDNPIIGIYPNNLSYQYVQVQKLSDDNKNNGLTKYEFKIYLDEQLDGELPVISNSSLRGQLLKESVYDSGNNLLSETANYYSNHPKINRSSRGLKVKQGIHISSSGLCPAGHDEIFLLEHLYVPYDYTYYSYWCKMDSTVKHSYYGASSVREKTEYIYNDTAICHPTQVTTVLNNGKKRITNFTYPPEITKELQFDTKEEKMDNTVIYKQTNKYSRTSIPSAPHLPHSIVSLDSVHIKYGANAEETAVKMKRDAKYNIVELLSRSTTPTTYIWGYSNQYPIARIDNVSYSEICKKIGGGTEVTGKTALETIAAKAEPSAADFTMVNNLRASFPNALITTYTYKPLIGILTATDPSGITTYYEYDPFGRLKRTYIKEGTTERTIQQYDYHYQNQ